MNTVSAHRQRGFRYRRLSFALKTISLLWSISMVGVLVVDVSWLNLFISITGLIAFCTPAILIAATFDTYAENEFMKASAAHASPAPLLGVVHPKS